jgi:4-hydroxybenzoate polyprenyltransferase
MTHTAGTRLIAYLRLMRPANILTAIADILLGFAASGIWAEGIGSGEGSLRILGWLILATTGLYGGGVVFNDFFDYKLDQRERPERPLPSGAATRTGALLLGLSLLLMGILAAFAVSSLSGWIALAVAAGALFYDAQAKHHPFFGPLVMGACRGGNLLLGVSAVPASVGEWWFLALIPVTYIAAITMVSRGEVDGGNRRAIDLALLLYVLVAGAMLLLGLSPNFRIFALLPFLLLFVLLVFPPLLSARQTLAANLVRKAVKAGILALIVLDATLAAGFLGWVYGLLVLALLPLSIALGKMFAVT